MKKTHEWIKREICDIIEFCEINSMPLTRDSLLMALVSLNLDQYNLSNSTTDLKREADLLDYSAVIN